MTKKFLLKERRRISSIPHTGISPARYSILGKSTALISDYVDNENKTVHTFRRNAFLNYEVWRKERYKEFGKDIPKQTTINLWRRSLFVAV